jgi:phage recombination protein Bet
MSNENKPAVQQENALMAGMGREQIELIKATVARGATDNELKLFLYTASRTKLDPLTKQIHFIKRRVRNPRTGNYDEVGTIQTGIDGYRVVAARNGLAGIEDAVFDNEDAAHPNKASVTVYKMIDGQRVPFTASARWKEYAQLRDGKPTAMWAKMPYLMLAKVAEALALRKAFPNDLTGIYTNEEMAQADAEEPRQPEIVHYEVKRVAPVAEDEAGGSRVGKEAVLEEINEARKDQIKALLKDTLGKAASKKVVKELTGLDFSEENYEEIITKLTEIAHQGDPLGQVIEA